MKIIKTYYFELREPGERKPRRTAYPMTMEEASRLARGYTPVMATEKVIYLQEPGDPEYDRVPYGPSNHARYMAKASDQRTGDEDFVRRSRQK